jgi:hypothetical protein
MLTLHPRRPSPLPRADVVRVRASALAQPLGTRGEVHALVLWALLRD